MHPARVEVDNKGAVPERSVGTVIVPPEPDRKTILALTKRYEERGWGEVSETSYHAFLLWLEDTLNSEFMPHKWPQFDIRPEHLHTRSVEPGPVQVTELKPEMPIAMPGWALTWRRSCRRLFRTSWRRVVATVCRCMPVVTTGWTQRGGRFKAGCAY